MTPVDLATPLRTPADLDPLMERIGDARYVLLGEASHGTHEYYRWRAEITKRLVSERGFDLVAVEGDWPACFEVNEWVRGLHGDDARTATRTAALRPLGLEEIVLDDEEELETFPYGV